MEAFPSLASTGLSVIVMGGTTLSLSAPSLTFVSLMDQAPSIRIRSNFTEFRNTNIEPDGDRHPEGLQRHQLLPVEQRDESGEHDAADLDPSFPRQEGVEGSCGGDGFGRIGHWQYRDEWAEVWFKGHVEKQAPATRC